MWTETDVEKILEIMNSLAESCSQIIKAFSDWADEVRAALDRAFNNPELYPDAHGTPPKKYGMSQRKRPYNSVCHYHYIPTAPRNLPYMRRAY